MIFCNHLEEFKKLSRSLEYHRSLEVLCTLLAPVAHHIASELWESLAGVSERSKPLVSSSVNKLYAYINNYNHLKPLNFKIFFCISCFIFLLNMFCTFIILIKGNVFQEKWPSWTGSLVLQESTTVVLQVCINV